MLLLFLYFLFPFLNQLHVPQYVWNNSLDTNTSKQNSVQSKKHKLRRRFYSVSLSPVTTDQTFTTATASHTFMVDKTKLISLNRYELLYSLIATFSFKQLLFNPAARLETEIVKE